MMHIKLIFFLLQSIGNCINMVINSGAAGYMPYTYAALPQTPSLPAATAGAFPGLPYQAAAAQAPTIQEARLP